MKDILHLSNLVAFIVLASCAPEPSYELLSVLAAWKQMEYPADNEPMLKMPSVSGFSLIRY